MSRVRPPSSSIVPPASGRQPPADDIGDRLRLESLIAELAARFVNLPAEQIDREVSGGVGSIVRHLELDRGAIAEWNAERAVMHVTHGWARPGIPPLPNEASSEMIPWIFARGLRGQATAFSRPDDLPCEADRDKDTLRQLGVITGLFLPFMAADRLVGALVLDLVEHQRSWPESVVKQLALVVRIFTDALERKRIDLELRTAYHEIERLRDKLKAENVYLREEARRSKGVTRIVGQSSGIQQVLSLVEQVAVTEATVLITGETGVGKELIAEALHAQSKRRESTMVKVNCAALPASLVEGELFGREKGAYTGALTKQIGRFELAHESTIFLDEVAELPLDLQAKLLRVLQSGEFERLGSPRTIRVDVRVIAATNKSLESEVAEGRFRSDLYYRLAVFPIHVPPLRERPDDIAPITSAIADEVARKMGKRIDGIADESLSILERHAWPGNVRELRNVVERAIILSREPILRIDLPERPRAAVEAEALRLEDVERRHITDILERTGWRVRGPDGAAMLLGLPPSTLEFRMSKLGIRRSFTKKS